MTTLDTTIPATPPAAAPSTRRREPVHGAHIGTGRRKTAVARIRLRPGSGKVVVNDRPFDAYFTQLKDQAIVLAPLVATSATGQYDVYARVHGGGMTGQAGAIRMGLARALVNVKVEYEPSLRDGGHLTRDAREVERKKYGRRKARRRFQFSKR